ncbi:CinA family nicotinamide mononucleotide deamidase-related protein [Crocinitomix catalasitica]|uniref:CinA family nicotinamide mononucleotide deamidase-related protein n=1 Tax=Crocinitomix catalasitica TaxID=184607 RepID=UPI00048A035C|nr:CinA family nicotinamide mononucleotide deamidase-related protein [Crocinitomix catalasitica]
MTASIITIGDEILVGQTIDTNSAFIAKQLHFIGVKIREIKSISDTEKHIQEALTEALKYDDFIFLTGGLGPTNDDITKKVLTEYFDDELILYPEILNKIKFLFARSKKPFLEVNMQQAMLPKNAQIIENMNGTASGMLFKKNNQYILSMPGVPYEMKGIVETYIPMIQAEFGIGNFYHKTRIIAGIGESYLAEMIKDWEESLRNEKITVSYLPNLGTLKLRLTGRLDQKEIIDSALEKLEKEHPKYVVGTENETLESVVCDYLVSKKQTLGTIESCTGGALSKKIVNISGASTFYEGSLITYSNRLKANLVNVKETTLEKHGAVSEEVVREMAINGKKILGVDYAISISGISGPSGGTKEKPVGLVWMAIATPENVYSKSFNFSQNRTRNIELTASAALNYLRLILLGLYIEE